MIVLLAIMAFVGFQGWSAVPRPASATEGVSCFATNNSLTGGDLTPATVGTPTPTDHGCVKIIKRTWDANGDWIAEGTFGFSRNGYLGTVDGGGFGYYFNIPVGAGNVTESTVPAGWTNLGGQITSTFDECVDSDEPPAGLLTTLPAPVVSGKITYVCWHNQRAISAKIELKKVWVGTPGATKIRIGNAPGNSAIDSQVVNGADGTTGENGVGPGTFYLSEDTPTGGTFTTSLACFKDLNNDGLQGQGEAVVPSQGNAVTVAVGDDIVCTFTNTNTNQPPGQNQGTLVITKKVDSDDADALYSNGSVATPLGSFTFGLNNGGPTNIVATGGGAAVSTLVNVGTYELTELALAGFGNKGGVLAGEGCSSSLPATPDTTLAVTITAGQTTSICWYNEQLPGTPPCTVNCGGGGGGVTDGGDGGTQTSVSPPPTTAGPSPQVLGSSAQITKVLASADPARVGERVNFMVTMTVSGDSTVTGVTLVDTFENAYLRYVGSTPAGCTVSPSTPDAAHSQITCPLGDVTPGTLGNPGSRSFAYMFAFDALAVTPTSTVNVVSARADLDGAGPAAPATVGPAQATARIIGISLSLPNAGSGLLGKMMPPWQLLALLGVLATVLGLTAHEARSGRFGRRTR